MSKDLSVCIKKVDCPQCGTTVNYYYKGKTTIKCKICRTTIGKTSGNYYHI